MVFTEEMQKEYDKLCVFFENEIANKTGQPVSRWSADLTTLLQIMAKQQHEINVLKKYVNDNIDDGK